MNPDAYNIVNFTNFWKISVDEYESPSYLFQQVIIDMSTYGVSFKIKIDIHIFSKAAGVVITVSFRIAKSFQNTVGFQQHVLHPLKNTHAQKPIIKEPMSYTIFFYRQET